MAKISTSVIGGSAPYNYLWSTGETTDSIIGLSAGTYTVTITDINGCSVVDSSIIAIFNCSIETNITGTDVSCNGANDGTASLTVTGGDPAYMVTWNDGVAGDLMRTELAAGVYSVTIRDQSGCELTDSLTISQPDSLMFSSLQIDNLCSSDSTGSISITTIVGNQGSTSIAWSTGSSDSSLVGLSAGEYSVSIMDTAGCTSIDSFTLTDPEPVLVTLDSIAVNGDSTWSIFTSPSGGTGTYLAEWSDSSAIVSLDLNPTVNNPGYYSLSLSDDNGCETSLDSVFIEALTTSIVDLQFDSETKIWPTIVHSSIQIELPISNSNFLLHIFNNSGIVLEKFTLTSGVSTKTLDDYSPGVYYLRIAGNQVFTMKKFIIK